jgi:hypothetical protein
MPGIQPGDLERLARRAREIEQQLRTINGLTDTAMANAITVATLQDTYRTTKQQEFLPSGTRFISKKDIKALKRVLKYFGAAPGKEAGANQQ